MPNHPGRKPGSASPDPALIRSARERASQTQTAAAETVHATLRTWQDWEAGKRSMPRAAWELYLVAHCVAGGKLLAIDWEDWIRPELVHQCMAVQRRRAAA